MPAFDEAQARPYPRELAYYIGLTKEKKSQHLLLLEFRANSYIKPLQDVL